MITFLIIVQDEEIESNLCVLRYYYLFKLLLILGEEMPDQSNLLPQLYKYIRMVKSGMKFKMVSFQVFTVPTL